MHQGLAACKRRPGARLRVAFTVEWTWLHAGPIDPATGRSAPRSERVSMSFFRMPALRRTCADERCCFRIDCLTRTFPITRAGAAGSALRQEGQVLFRQRLRQFGAHPGNLLALFGKVREHARIVADAEHARGAFA